ncbi:hypothetical protein Tco_0676578 [Tanacetum coccineum]
MLGEYDWGSIFLSIFYSGSIVGFVYCMIFIVVLSLVDEVGAYAVKAGVANKVAYVDTPAPRKEPPPKRAKSKPSNDVDIDESSQKMSIKRTYMTKFVQEDVALPVQVVHLKSCPALELLEAFET